MFLGCDLESAQASEIQSKLVAAIRQIAELEEKIEQCEKKSKELSADVDRRSRQTFYLERNLDTRDKEISELNRSLYTLSAKSDPDDFEAMRDDQDASMSRGARRTEVLKAELAEAEADEKRMAAECKKAAADLTKASSSSQEIISMFMEEFEKAAKEYAATKGEIQKTQGNLVDESSVYDLQKKHCRYLDQYRTDSIFRLFGLKAHVKVLTEKIESQQGINKLASSIGV